MTLTKLRILKKYESTKKINIRNLVISFNLHICKGII